MNKPLSFLSMGVSLTLAFSSMPSHALDAWELYQQAKPDQVGVIAASKIAREQCTKENEPTPCNNIGNVLRVFRKKIKTYYYDGHGTPEQKQLFDEGKLWCPHFKDTEQAISLLTETDREEKANFKKNLDEVKNKYHITTPTRLNTDSIIASYTSRKNFFIKEVMTYGVNVTFLCEDYIGNRIPLWQAITENRSSVFNQKTGEIDEYVGEISEMEYDLSMYEYYRDENRTLNEITAEFNKYKDSPSGIKYNRDDFIYQPSHSDTPREYHIYSIAPDLYYNLGDTLRFQHRKDIPAPIVTYRLKGSHVYSPLNPIITAQYLDSLIATKNQSEIATVQRFLEGIAYPLMQAERKSEISKLQESKYFGNPRISDKCQSLVEPKCSTEEANNISVIIKKMREASALLMQKSELYEAAAKQANKLALPKYYENYFLHYSALFSKNSVELKWNIDAWRKLAQKVASSKSGDIYNTPQSNAENNAEQSGEGASSNFNRMIESSRPYLKGKDLQRLNQYQNGMDLLNSIMGQ